METGSFNEDAVLDTEVSLFEETTETKSEAESVEMAQIELIGMVQQCLWFGRVDSLEQLKSIINYQASHSLSSTNQQAGLAVIASIDQLGMFMNDHGLQITNIQPGNAYPEQNLIDQQPSGPYAQRKVFQKNENEEVVVYEFIHNGVYVPFEVGL